MERKLAGKRVENHREAGIHRLIIAGSLYLLNIQYEQLVKSDNHEMVIPFKDMKKEEKDYLFDISASDGRLAAADDYQRFGDAFFVRTIRIPEEVILHGYREGGNLAEKVNERAYREQTGAVLIDENIQRRLNGELPKLEIGKSSFTVDTENRQLITEDGKNALPLNAFQKDGWDIGHLVLYESITEISSTQKNGQNERTSFTAILRFPSEIRLDPVGYALRNHLRPMKYLSDIPIVMQQKALIEQSLTEQIHRNQVENETVDKTSKPPKRQKGIKHS